MARWVKVLAITPEYSTSIPGTYIGEEELPPVKFCDLHLCMPTCERAHTHAIKFKKEIKNAARK